jgi:hypothetical protein
VGRIVIRDGLQRRTVPTSDVVGELTIRVDLSGGERTVVLPADVRVEREGSDGRTDAADR